ncbi:hypothetical protein GUITHDRAFT_152098 [Guillardia theta CCMP2712]|uniref:SP-RING-type domain-containing protein n=2 Tax=Guillardia theta TaxID=55529 RepID=L1JGF0_GUITC|nr:hypothetical protein GUITHDRAFT_152098 [Guillardia theta CCMP2712]EKX47387.1 hypothetical protein GUITHDRAFT_152098 [Guillardia theta CCMP2712]|eukprot:XP_005834367.1 hypothetical protein GUITHDRAFT_152098 [Guillardia theta CCMP2712]
MDAPSRSGDEEAVKDGGGAGSKRSIQSSGPAGHAEDDIILEKQELSLLCPLSLVRMRVPVRGDCCEHIQCFDQDAWHSFVSKQNSNRPPHCPICKKPVTTTSEDPRFARLLELVPKETSKVWVDEEWQPVIEEDDQVSKKARYEDLQNDSDSDVIVLD